jgi:hypothetical protein
MIRGVSHTGPDAMLYFCETMEMHGQRTIASPGVVEHRR